MKGEERGRRNNISEGKQGKGGEEEERSGK